MRPEGAVRPRPLAVAFFAVLLTLAACEQGTLVAPPEDSPVIDVWFHAPSGPERRVLDEQVEAFNLSQSDVVVRPRLLPEGAYEEEIRQAAVDGDLPDLLDVPRPLFLELAGQDTLTELEPLLPRSLPADLLPWAVRDGSPGDQWLGVPTTAALTVLLYNQDSLRAAGVEVPGSVLNVTQFTAIMQQVRSHTGRPVLDLGLGSDRREDWSALAMLPLVASTGGGYVLDEGRTGTRLTTYETQAAFRIVERWAEDDLLRSGTEADLVSGVTTALWADTSQVLHLAREMGGTLQVGPTPWAGPGPSTAHTARMWVVPASSDEPELAARFLAFLAEGPQVAAMHQANGGYPAVRSALPGAPLYGPGGALEVQGSQMAAGDTATTPAVPQWSAVAGIVGRALNRVIAGDGTQEVLTAAAAEIDDL